MDVSEQFSDLTVDGILWLEETWPEILPVTRDKQAMNFVGDEASFAQ